MIKLLLSGKGLYPNFWVFVTMVVPILQPQLHSQVGIQIIQLAPSFRMAGEGPKAN